MTMDNGEGLPLDEAESGNEDPQGWYFDLPGGAWERQEEKNRNLRQRVLGNLSEDDARAKSDPFGRKPSEPEKRAGRGFFGRRKKEEESGEKTSAGGTWVLNRGSQDALEPLRAPDAESDFANESEDDEWTTEPPLKLSPFPHAERREQAEWGESDGGWDLSRPDTAETFESEAGSPEVPEPTTFELQPAEVEPLPFPSVEGHESQVIDETGDTEDFLTSMRNWAHEQPHAETPVYRLPAVEDSTHDVAADRPARAENEDFEEPHTSYAPVAEESEPEPERDPLTLRARHHESDGKELDWNFGPAAWSDEPTTVSTTPEPPMTIESVQTADFEDPGDGESSDGMSFESMRQWAERNREKDHPHFTVAHREPEPVSVNPELPLTARLESELGSQAGQTSGESPDEEDADGMSFESMRQWAERNREKDHPHFTVAHREPEPVSVNPEPPLTAGLESEAGSQAGQARGDSPYEEDADGMSFESMRAWAERNRGKERPHFNVNRPEAEEEEASPSPAPIPLRPRLQEPGSTVAADSSATAGHERPESPAPIQIPIVLRSRTEPPPEPVDPGAPSKWNDFFAITPPADSDESTGEDDQPSEGLAAMRAWAQKRAEPESPDDIPEEFLKPFDWELEEDAETEEATLEEIPAELLKPFAWEEADAEQPVSSEAFEPVATEPAAFEAQFPGAPAPSLFEPAPPMPSPIEAEFGSPVENDLTNATSGEDDDPLDGLFSAASAPVEKVEKKPGRFGRLFGRGKAKHSEPEVTPATDAGDWVLPADDADDDIRVAARVNDWTDDAGTLEAADLAKRRDEGWSASLTSGWADSDNEAISEFSSSVFEAASESPALEAPVADEWAADNRAPEAVAFAEGPASEASSEDADLAAFAPADSEPAFPVSEPAEEEEWNPEPVVADDLAAAVWKPLAVSPASGDQPLTTFESFEWVPESEVEAPVEAVASVDAVVEEPVAEKAWWETAAAEEPEVDAPVEAFASMDPVVEEPVAEKAWWETAAPTDESESEASVETAAPVDTIVEEPVAEKPWWETTPKLDEPQSDAPVEAVASVDAIVEEPVAEKAWWETAAPTDESESEASVEAVAYVDAVVEEPVAEKPWWETAPQTDEPVAEALVEAVASVDAVVEEPVADKPWWETTSAEAQETEASVEAAASVEAVVEEPVAETAWWETAPQTDESESEAPVEAVASVDAVVEEPVAEKAWWETAAAEEPEVDAPVEAFASMDPVVEEPVAEKAWWETAAPTDESESEASVEAAASVDTIVEEPVAEKPWWETTPKLDEPQSDAPVEAVASVDAIVEEPVTEKAWWEAAAAEEPEVEAAGSVEAVVDEPVAETAWWETAPQTDEPESDAPVDAVASVDAIVEEPVAEKAWWETAAAEEPEVHAPVEAFTSVDLVVEEPVAEKPWWETAPKLDEPPSEAPVEAVAFVDAGVEEPVAEKAWWETAPQTDEPESGAPVEAAASEDAVVEEPVAEKAWWETAPKLDEPQSGVPVEAAASVDAVVEEPVAKSTWWETAPQTDEPQSEAPVEAVAFVDAVVEESVADWGGSEEPEAEASTQAASSVTESATDDDDPWADFVTAPARGATPEAAPVADSIPWRHEPVRPPAEEDVWGHIADQTEEAAASDPHQIDLAASLESQMAETPEPAYRWAQPADEEWEAAPPEPPGAFAQDHDEDDVILAAFERHAATPDAVPASRENDEVFAELLGTEAADIVAEADDEDAGRQSFIKMTGWAPQRGGDSFDGGWAPEQEVEEALSGNRHSAFGGTDGAGFAPPPWAVDELEGDGEAQAPAHSHHRTKTWIRELVETGLLALLVFLSVRASFQNFKVEGSSMYPTLENGQFLIVNKLVYSEVDMDKLSSYVPFVDAGSDPKRQVFHGPERGDIIVLKDPRNTETDLIKRVIGLPGETIEIVDGKVYINDQLLDEPYIKAVWHDTKPKIAIPPGEFFVMGDNRDNSLDSRSSQVGLVPQDLIIGKAMLSYWPRDKFGLAPNEEGTLGEQKPVLTTKRIGED